MKIVDHSFKHLPFSNLFKTYTTDFQKLKDFYEVNPFDEGQIAQHIENYSFKGDRQQSAEILSAFNLQFTDCDAVMDNIDRLKQKNALAVVTGQQLGMYGGPMYTVLKAITTIHLARQLEDEFNRPVVPVFWLADEDHDYEEIRSLQLIENDEVHEYKLPSKNGKLPPVSELQIPEEFSKLRQQVQQSLVKTDFHDELWELLDQCFESQQTFLQASGRFMASLFSKHGLILAGSNIPSVKSLTSWHMKHSIAEADAIREALEQKTNALAGEYHQQVHLYDSNLFYLEPGGKRTKIHRNGNGWGTSNGTQWQTSELIRHIENEPSSFSPNVFLRPILQDVLLPTLGYIAGPGETSYYGQMKEMYRCFNLKMPIIFPRLSATFIEPALKRISDQLPFRFHEYAQRIEDLETEYVNRTEQTDIPRLFEDWRKEIIEIAEERKKTITAIDPTLEQTVGRTTAKYFNELDRLRVKVYRAVKKQDRIQMKRIKRLQSHLFAGNQMQERGISSIFYMNKYGIDIWDHLLEGLDENETFDQHKLVYL